MNQIARPEDMCTPYAEVLVGKCIVESHIANRGSSNIQSIRLIEWRSKIREFADGL